MKTSHALETGLAVVAALACLVALASPASATVHAYDVYMVSGRFSVGSMNFDTPGSGATSCPPPAVGGTRVTGTINDATTTANITATLAITSLFKVPAFPPFFTGGNYALIATGTATGNYNNGTGNFSGLAFTNVVFTIRTVVSCVATTTVVCSGTASLDVSGGLYNGATLPLSTSENIFVNATGTILTRGTCTLPFSLFVTVGTPLSLGDNPNDDVAPTGTDPGAIFHQLDPI